MPEDMLHHRDYPTDSSCPIGEIGDCLSLICNLPTQVPLGRGNTRLIAIDKQFDKHDNFSIRS